MFSRILAFFASARSENAETLRSSVTWRVYRRSSILYGALIILFTAVLVLDIGQAARYPSNILTFEQVIFYGMYAALLFYSLYIIWQQLRLLVASEAYIFREVTLENPTAHYRSVTFSLTFPDHLNRSIRAETLPLTVEMVNHVGHRALVGYNPETRLTVLIRPLPDKPSM